MENVEFTVRDRLWSNTWRIAQKDMVFIKKELNAPWFSMATIDAVIGHVSDEARINGYEVDRE